MREVGTISLVPCFSVLSVKRCAVLCIATSALCKCVHRVHVAWGRGSKLRAVTQLSSVRRESNFIEWSHGTARRLNGQTLRSEFPGENFRRCAVKIETPHPPGLRTRAVPRGAMRRVAVRCGPVRADGAARGDAGRRGSVRRGAVAARRAAPTSGESSFQS